MPRKNKREEKMRPSELRFWQNKAEAEEAADAKKVSRSRPRQTRTDQGGTT